MNTIEITKDKFSSLIQSGLFKIIETKVNDLYEYIVLEAAISGLSIMRDKRENTTDIMLFIKKTGEVPSILDDSHWVNVIFYLSLEEIFEPNDDINEFVALEGDTYAVIEKFFEILSKNMDKFINPSMDAFKLAIKSNDKYLVESVHQFEKLMEDDTK